MKRMEIRSALVRLRRYSGMTQKEASAVAGMSEGHWHDVESGRRTPELATLEKMARPFGVEVALIHGHHRPFLELDPAEAYEVMRIVAHYRRKMHEPPEVLVTLARKLEKWTRGRNPVGRPRKVTA